MRPLVSILSPAVTVMPAAETMRRRGQILLAAGVVSAAAGFLLTFTDPWQDEFVDAMRWLWLPGLLLLPPATLLVIVRRTRRGLDGRPRIVDPAVGETPRLRRLVGRPDRAAAPIVLLAFYAAAIPEVLPVAVTALLLAFGCAAIADGLAGLVAARLVARREAQLRRVLWMPSRRHRGLPDVMVRG